jgi:hypothetical protein
MFTTLVKSGELAIRPRKRVSNHVTASEPRRFAA